VRTIAPQVNSVEQPVQFVNRQLDGLVACIGLGLEAGFYPISTDGLKRAENFRSCLATLRRILGL
jgi:hypothetical protein